MARAQEAAGDRDVLVHGARTTAQLALAAGVLATQRDGFAITAAHGAVRVPDEGSARLVRSSHERLDGAGYPEGLRGEEIPLGSRIIHVADAFDEMTSERPYREPPPRRGRSRSCGAARAPSSTRSWSTRSNT